VCIRGYTCVREKDTWPTGRENDGENYNIVYGLRASVLNTRAFQPRWVSYNGRGEADVKSRHVNYFIRLDSGGGWLRE